MKSEVTSLLEQFQLEAQAAQLALTGFASVSSHQFIEARMANMGRIGGDVAELVGSDEAVKLIVEAWERAC